MLRKNLLTLQGQSYALSARIDCLNAINFLSEPNLTAYDVVFLDPPFNSDLLEQATSLIAQGNWLAEGAMIYMERDANKEIVEMPPSWRLHRQGKAGQSAFYLYIS